MQAVILGAAAAALLLAGPAMAGFPYNGLAPIRADPAVMALAQKAVGKRCRFVGDLVGPQVAGFRNAPGVGQSLEWNGFVFVRQRGAQRVAFLAHEVDSGPCTVRAVQPLPPKAAREMFLQCRIEDPDPFKTKPISSGLGLRQNGKRDLAAYLEADADKGALTPRDGTDRRIRCSEFESGD